MISLAANRHEGQKKRPLRIMQVHSFYGVYLDAFYAEHSKLAEAPLQTQEQALFRDGLGATWGMK